MRPSITKKILLIVGVVCFISSQGYGQEVDSVLVQKLLTRYACKSCHLMKSMPVGPGWLEMAQREYTRAEFINLIGNPKPENWPDYPPMTPMAYVLEKDLEKIYNWMLTLKKDE